MKWYIADKSYVKVLNSIDKKVEFIDYGNDIKPYLGILLKINNFNYYVPISSPKSKHHRMKNDIDFIKVLEVIDENNSVLIAVLNLNNMVPIPDQYVKKLYYQEIEQYKIFSNNSEKERYIDLLRKELEIINSQSEIIRKSAEKLYEKFIENPNSKLAQRCCDFKLLEDICTEFESEAAATHEDEELEL